MHPGRPLWNSKPYTLQERISKVTSKGWKINGLQIFQLPLETQRPWRNAIILLEGSNYEPGLLCPSRISNCPEWYLASPAWFLRILIKDMVSSKRNQQRFLKGVIWGGELWPEENREVRMKERSPGRQRFPDQTGTRPEDLEETFSPGKWSWLKYSPKLSIFVKMKLRAKTGLGYQWVHRNLSKKRLNKDFLKRHFILVSSKLRGYCNYLGNLGTGKGLMQTGVSKREKRHSLVILL